MTSANLSLLAAGATAGGPPAWSQIPFFVGLFAIMWFLLIRPQMKQQKDHRAKIAGLKKGDQVVTGGGLVGKVIKLDDNFVDLELGPNVKVRAVRSSISDVIAPPGAAND